jgi:hypothetical protein
MLSIQQRYRIELSTSGLGNEPTLRHVRHVVTVLLPNEAYHCGCVSTLPTSVAAWLGNAPLLHLV